MLLEKLVKIMIKLIVQALQLHLRGKDQPVCLSIHQQAFPVLLPYMFKSLPFFVYTKRGIHFAWYMFIISSTRLPIGIIPEVTNLASTETVLKPEHVIGAALL